MIMDKKSKKHCIVLTSNLLELAKIPPDADLTVAYEDGKITVSEADVLDYVPEELQALFEELGISADTVRAVLRENNGILNALAVRET